MIDVREIRHFHLFGAIGGGADGFNKGEARIGNMVAKYRCIGSVDVDAAANRDFERRIGVKATTLDLFDRSQYIAFNGKEPPADWREATPEDIRAAAGHEFPHIVFLSAPCKGFSGLLSENRSRTDKYQALNRLTLRGVWLMLEAFGDNPPELIIFENVPRIASRGRHLLDQIGALLRQYGYAVAETTHDCGELGGLAQSRKRFLMVARHIEKVPPFLYEPQKKSLRSVGEVIGRLPLPGDPAGGVMHRVPALQWKTWVRLAFVEAGSDWRSLNRLAVVDGALRDYLIVPEMHNGTMGVMPWDSPMGTVTGNARPMTGNFSIADPRFPAGGEYGQLGVRAWDESTGTVTGQRSPIQGGFSVADPRTGIKHNNCFRVVRFDHAAGTITGGTGPSAGGQAVADPRRVGPTYGKYGVTGWGESSGTVISGSTTGQGAYAVADPRPGLDRSKGDHYLTGGHYGVVPWDTSAGAVSSSACHDNGRWSVADPRASGFSTGNEGLPAADERIVARIIAEDETWHRPFTTLELASLQGLVDPEEQFELDGLSDSAWRERIGNAVPPPAAAAIASEMGRTLLLAWSGETFALGCTPIWVRPVAIALSVAQGGAA